MRVHLSLIARLVCLAMAGALAACGGSDRGSITVVTIGKPDDPFEKGVRLSFSGQLARASTTEGLVGFDPEGRIIPALADSWIVTDDGQSYIFRLRDGTWRDGTAITSEEAVRSIKSAIRALRGTSLGLDLEVIEDVRSMAGRVVEIRLLRPAPNFLQVLAQPELGLTHAGKGTGPMSLEREGEIALLSAINPKELGMQQVPDWESRTRTLRLLATSGEEAVAMFNRGEADLVLDGRIADFPRTASVGILRGTIQLDPVIGLFGLKVMNDKGFLAEPANREAIALAIDREALIAPLGVDGWEPSSRVVTPSLDGDLGTVGERWPDLTAEGRQALAKARIDAWRQGRKDDTAVPPLRIWLPPGPGSDKLFESLNTDLVAVGLEIVRAKTVTAADLVLIDDVARYPRATWFLNRLSCGAKSGLCSKAADARVAEASRITDPAERAALLAEAEAELTQENSFIPFGPPIRWSLVRGNIDAFSTNRWGWHPLMPMALIPK